MNGRPSHQPISEFDLEEKRNSCGVLSLNGGNTGNAGNIEEEEHGNRCRTNR